MSTEQELIKRFVEDRDTSRAVYQAVHDFFLKRRKLDDVQMLAAERLGLFLLEDAWKEMERLAVKNEDPTPPSNPGL